MSTPSTTEETKEHSTRGAYVHAGEEFNRDTNYIEDRIVARPEDFSHDAERAYWPVETGKYRLVAARACPWANRTLIVRRLLGLEDAISLGLPGPTHDVRSWTFDLDESGVDPVLGIERLQEAYFKRFPDYPRGITVPAVVDIESGAVVTNDFPQITEDFSKEWKELHRDGAPDLWPAEHEDEMNTVMKRIYTEINNGVYRCGFAGTQETYEADIRLFTTLVRFDAVYYSHFKCSRQTLASMPNLWGYARDLFQTPGFGDTVDFQQIKEHYFIVHEDINPTGIVPVGPDLSGWLTEHGREKLGGSPFNEAAGAIAPEPVRASERVTAAHNPLYS